MLNRQQLRELVIRPTLFYLEPEVPFSKEAEDLLVMVCCHESKRGTFLKQLGGPALGIYQMEPDTETDIYDNFLEYRPQLADKVLQTCNGGIPKAMSELVGNLFYATAMARVHFYRVPENLPIRPEKGSLEAYHRELAEYSKKHYNTAKGKAMALDYYYAYLRSGLE